jgi:DNA mismatch endonuclease (patch repair protein)
MDKISSAQRSANMRAVRGKNTLPEMLIRRAAHALGLRFRLHRKTLPGRPDLTFAKFRTVIFVNGCFWHSHAGCPRAKPPTSNVEFWCEKLDSNVARDQRNRQALEYAGWHVAVIWQCQIRDTAAAVTAIRRIPSLRIPKSRTY